MSPSLPLSQSRLIHTCPPRDLGCFRKLPMPVTWLGYSLFGLPRSCHRSKSQTQALKNHNDINHKLRQNGSIALHTAIHIYFISHSPGWVEEVLLGLNNSVGHNYNYFAQCIWFRSNPVHLNSVNAKICFFLTLLVLPQYEIYTATTTF
jgi:hypothetical protein